MRLIDLDKALIEAEDECRMSDDWKVSHEMMNVFKYQPTVKAITIELYEQIKGERDVAVEQLKSLNIELFEKPYLKAIPIEYIEKFKKEFRAVASVKAVIEWLLEKWEKENETDRR